MSTPSPKGPSCSHFRSALTRFSAHFAAAKRSFRLERDTDILLQDFSNDLEPGIDMSANVQLRPSGVDIDQLIWQEKAAQKKAKEALQKVEELETLKQKLTDTAGKLDLDLKKLRDENQILKEGLNDAQSHIFSLQPYRKELTLREVSQHYCDFVEQVQDWVQRFMDPWLNDAETGPAALVFKSKHSPGQVFNFQNALDRCPDLLHGAQFPETDEDIIAALVLRFLDGTIFQKTLYGSIKDFTGVIGIIEEAMQASVEPKRDLFAVKTWAAEAYNALLSVPQFQEIRSRRSRELGRELAEILRIFCKEGQFRQFCQGMEELCVRPAMELYEKFLVSTNHFYLDISPFITWEPIGGFVRSSELYDHLGDLDCKNVLQNRKAFNVAKLDPQPTKDQLHDELVNVCAVAPALCVRQIGQGDNFKAPAIVCKQHMLVAWGSKEKLEKFESNNGQTLVARLYFSQI